MNMNKPVDEVIPQTKISSVNKYKHILSKYYKCSVLNQFRKRVKVFMEVYDAFSHLLLCFFVSFDQVELQRAVQECSETDGGAGGGGVHQRLLNILTRLLQEGGASAEGGGAWEAKGHSHTSLNF